MDAKRRFFEITGITPDGRRNDYKNFVREFNTNNLTKGRFIKSIITGYNNNLNRLRRNTEDNITLNIDIVNNNRNSLINFLNDIRVITIGDNNYIYNINLNGRYYTINDDVLVRLRDIIANGFEIINTQQEGSDIAILRNFVEINELVINKRLKAENTNNTREGSWFPYYLKDKYKFETHRYQVFNRVGSFCNDRNSFHCLLFSLIMADISEDKLEFIKFMIKRKHLPMAKINEICDVLKVKIRVRLRKPNGNIDYTVYGKDYEKTIDIGYICKHYFIIEKTKYTKYSILNYDDIKNEKDFNKIIGYQDDGKYFKRRNDRFIDSFELIELLYENKDKYLDEIDLKNVYANDELYTNNLKNYDFNILEYDNKKNTKIVEGNKNIHYDNDTDNGIIKAFFDFETFENDNLVTPFQVVINILNETRSFQGENFVIKMLEFICKKTKNIKKPKILMIAHNAKYDSRFIVKHFKKCSEINCGTSFIKIKGEYKGRTLIIKDSYKLITEPLKNFPKMFGFEGVKEFMPYKLYTKENIEKRIIDYKYIVDNFIDNKEDLKLFNENINKWFCKSSLNNVLEVDIVEYSRQYCKIDVEILKKGYEIFRQRCIDNFNIDIDNVLTNPSLSYNYFIDKGCFDKVLKISGIPRQFIQKCVVGGRVMCNENKKIILLNYCGADYDACSLYPSAKYRLGEIGGFLIGEPKVLTNFNYEFVKKYDGYFVEIVIVDVGIKRKFPLMSYINDDGIRIFTNDMIGKKMFVDKFSLEDLIEFQKVKFKILKGYYFDEGRNSKIKDVIKYVYDKRLELKSDGNKLEKIYKLLMNGLYGKTIQKETDDKIKIFNNKNDFDKYLTKNYNKIKEWIPYDNDNQYRAVVSADITEHFNSCHVGCEILSMSKRIMNEVICLCEDNNINIYYQDTDSLHIDKCNLDKIREIFMKKYGREITGDYLCQFNSDFDMNDVADKESIYARNSVFLGKKSYVDELVGIDENGNEKVECHYRMKGIPQNVISYYCKQNNLTILQLYKKLYAGDSVEFDLTNNGSRYTIKYKNNYDIVVLDKFNRRVKF